MFFALRPLRLALALRLAVVGIGATVLTPNVWAVLGQALPTTATTSSPTVAVQARALAPQSGAAALYTVHANVLDSGTTVSEYTTAAGIVFAVSWQGPVLPDLPTLLGTYFAIFSQAADNNHASRSLGTPLAIENDTLVVRSSGRMRNFSGYAYAPTLIPIGLDIHAVLP